MKSDRDDRMALRELAKAYAEVTADPVQEQRRERWRNHTSMRNFDVPVLTRWGVGDFWFQGVCSEDDLQCRDPFFRTHERQLRALLFHASIGDDYVCEPWITQKATRVLPEDGIWGITEGRVEAPAAGGAWKFDPPIREWGDSEKLVAPQHRIDEEATERNVSRLHDAVGDILPVNVDRGPMWRGPLADISTSLARLRGLEQIMIDMMESPKELHRLLAFMRDGILAAQDQAEAAGDWSLSLSDNQAQPYSHELPTPGANRPCLRADLWSRCAAQEFTLVSPPMHDEFMLQYQIPIYEKFGLNTYGCCEDLTRKIDMLRKFPNLRIIAVAPRADLASCAEQIRTDYAISWRPNPSTHVCCGFDEETIRREVRQALEVAEGCYMHIEMKDIRTLEGEPDRLARWTRIVRSEIERSRA